MRRMTRQRAAIWDTLGQTDEFRSAQQLHDALGERGESIGLATVYRALQALAEEGLVDRSLSAQAIEKYRLYDVTAGTTGNAGGES